jgi:hypothetical protein
MERASLRGGPFLIFSATSTTAGRTRAHEKAFFFKKIAKKVTNCTVLTVPFRIKFYQYRVLHNLQTLQMVVNAVLRTSLEES